MFVSKFYCLFICARGDAMYSVTGLIEVIFKDIGMLSNPVEQSLRIVLNIFSISSPFVCYIVL